MARSDILEQDGIEAVKKVTRRAHKGQRFRRSRRGQGRRSRQLCWAQKFSVTDVPQANGPIARARHIQKNRRCRKVLRSLTRADLGANPEDMMPRSCVCALSSLARREQANEMSGREGGRSGGIVLRSKTDQSAVSRSGQRLECSRNGPNGIKGATPRGGRSPTARPT